MVTLRTVARKDPAAGRPGIPSGATMRCPDCGDEYQPGIEVCADCRVPLGAGVSPAPDRLLGTFHPLAADTLMGLLAERGIAHRAAREGEAVRVLVEDTWRDPLRAELTVGWRELVGRLPRDEMEEVLAQGGRQPGWYDAPRGGWIDRAGRLKVAHQQEEREDDATRTVGPAMALAGAVLVLLGWYAAGPGWMPTLGLVLIVLGLLLPR